MSRIPLAPVDRIMRKAGAERISEDAKHRLRTAVEELGDEIAEDSDRAAEHAGRKTVRKEDIDLAVEV
jgi:histone H3/H4